eukprot:jgi/Chlat1/5367/Chrsp35S05212
MAERRRGGEGGSGGGGRAGKGVERAVRVYTVADESRYVIVRNVPAVRVIGELIAEFGAFGEILEYKELTDEAREEFTQVVWIKYANIQSARFAKRKMDEYSFFGAHLAVLYAPQYETVAETVDKLEERRRKVGVKLREHARELKGQRMNEGGSGRETSIGGSSHASASSHRVPPDTTSGRPPNHELPPIETFPATAALSIRDKLRKGSHTAGVPPAGVVPESKRHKPR